MHGIKEDEGFGNGVVKFYSIIFALKVTQISNTPFIP